jgi:hypothetical protein
MLFRLSPTEGAKIVRLDEELPESFRDEYWIYVKETLRRVFKKDTALADEARRKLEDLEAKKGRHTMFYHASPLEIAADLAGTAQSTPKQKEAYLQLQLSWNPAEPGEDAEAVRKEHLGVAHPES